MYVCMYVFMYIHLILIFIFYLFYLFSKIFFGSRFSQTPPLTNRLVESGDGEMCVTRGLSNSGSFIPAPPFFGGGIYLISAARSRGKKRKAPSSTKIRRDPVIDRPADAKEERKRAYLKSKVPFFFFFGLWNCHHFPEAFPCWGSHGLIE